jgi:hypothetical protein
MPRDGGIHTSGVSGGEEWVRFIRGAYAGTKERPLHTWGVRPGTWGRKPGPEIRRAADGVEPSTGRPIECRIAE